ncbi:D-galactose-binding periplasmic protein precursor [Clostridium puniceum]|uniref:D-galactose/methyl-galactoside binding periplasmic protein MglB n=1 Tax=Clostridium puniceum TaxID=29367 RepID=A0A1S8TAR7_9CLOT|nr:galactose ABC transporter substrate-binding protein [Clostridium puniceum]OOM74772.1 D-galactose-binding periplasmic protein precursor [Clostridium puniceum]
MAALKKRLLITQLLIILFTIIFLCNGNGISIKTINERQNPIKAAVLLYRFDDAYISLVRQSFEEIQKNNEGKIEFTFYDGKNDQQIQNQTIDTLLENKSADLLLLNMVNEKDGYEVIDRIKGYNVPVVLFNREPLDIGAVQSYNKAYFVGTNAAEAGVLQGRILIDEWNKNKTAIDINGDNILQYIMLMGESDNKEAIERTQYSVSTINDAQIQTQQLELAVCDWNREVARDRFEQLFLYYGNKIEAIISNNDEMAIGAIEALQKYGYNTGDSSKTISVVGIDALPAAQELIKQGKMTGSVLQDAPAMAEACYVIGTNLLSGKPPLEGTQYKFDETGVAVRIPYKEYMD